MIFFLSNILLYREDRYKGKAWELPLFKYILTLSMTYCWSFKQLRLNFRVSRELIGGNNARERVKIILNGLFMDVSTYRLSMFRLINLYLVALDFVKMIVLAFKALGVPIALNSTHMSWSVQLISRIFA